MKLFPDHWKTDSVSELCTDVVDCVNKTAPVVVGPTEYKMIRTTNVKSGRINLDDCRYVDEPTFVKWTRRIQPKRNDIVLTREAPLGEVGLLRSDEPVFLGQRTMLYRANSKKLDQRFLYYSMLGPLVQGQIRSQGSGATVEHLRVPDAEYFLVAYPSLGEQRRIAALLTAYDDLIANNQRRIALLESMAEEIYREWFVRMRFPGYETTAFSKGIPEGWDVVPLGQHCHVVKGKSYASDDLVDDETAMPFVTLKSFNRGGGYRAGGLKYYKGEFKAEQLVNQGDIVMAVTDMTQDRVVIGRAARVPNLGEKGAVISLDVIKLGPRNINSTYLYLFLRFSGFANYIKEFANGANVLHLKPDLVPAQKVLMAPRALQDRAALIAEPMLQQAEQLAESCRRLSEMRDALLPRLISGKLRVDALDIQFPPSMQLPPEEAALSATIKQGLVHSGA